MEYLLLTYADPTATMTLPKEKAREMYGAYQAYVAAMKSAGVFLGNRGLRPTAEATTLRIVNGKQTVISGPFAETKEQLGSYFLIDVPDLDAALSWAARCPAAEYGCVEVRPVWA